MQNQLAAQLAEAEARRRQLDSVEKDCSRLCALDNNRPFTDGADAFDRLLPWHVSCALRYDTLVHVSNIFGKNDGPYTPQVLAAGDPLEFDSDKAEAAEVLKHQAWLEATSRANISGLDKIQKAAQSLGIQLVAPQVSQPGKAVDSFLLERLLFEDNKLQLTEARTALTDKVHLGQLQQAASANQRAAQAAAQHAQGQFRPAAVPAQHSGQPAAWPVANTTAAQPAPAAGTVSGFRSFSITGRAKPPT